MATQTRTFLFPNIRSSAAMVQRFGDVYVGVLAERRWLIRTVLAAHGG